CASRTPASENSSIWKLTSWASAFVCSSTRWGYSTSQCSASAADLSSRASLTSLPGGGGNEKPFSSSQASVSRCASMSSSENRSATAARAECRSTIEIVRPWDHNRSAAAGSMYSSQ